MTTDVPAGAYPVYPPTPGTPAPPAPVRDYRRAAIEAAAVVVAFAAAGVAGGFVWHGLWEPPQGRVVDGEWLPLSYPDIGREFSATGLYVVVGLVGGVVLGLLAALVARTSELVTLGAVVLGSAAAGLIAWQLGVHLAPPDPTTLSGLSPDEDVAGTIVMPGSSWAVAWPLGALVPLFVIYVLTTGVDSSLTRTRGIDAQPGFGGNHRG